MFFDVFLRVALLIFISIIGLVVGKKFKLDSKDISSLLVYVISPFVIFYSIVQSPANWTYLQYSLGAFLLASGMALLGLIFASFIWKDSRKNLFGFAAGTGNTGYFALPLVLAIFNENQIAIAIFIIIGINLYEFTVGYFITAKGAMSYKDSLFKVIKMPILYAAIAGIILKYLNIPFNDITLSFLSNFKGAYSVLGMMTIGITISKFSKIEFDFKFSALSIIWKHLIYPIVGLLIFIYILPVEKYILQIIALMVATPMAGNVVVISNNLGLHPEKAATTVMISTVCALITVPLSLYFALSL
ncbi:AEC family transporter [Acinetobacter lactucae]|uniref:AEC family transporter n=1 Tax=Acinetobacter lactucae TaxID=1785128 RepID=UPI00237B556A|nr:AEC family transporter [Acinetobacter lactucae]MDD9316042.1 AEC family transporter [Acinetobacter lactucae]